jgi:hypothetical protein
MENGKRYKVGDEVLEVGEVVEYDGTPVAFRGRLTGKTAATPGLWLDPKGGLLLIERAPTDEIRNLMRTLDADPARRAESVVIDESHQAPCPDRLSSDEALRFEPDDADDDMVRALKVAVNASRLSVRDVSEGLSGGYNLVYGLRKRHSIKYESMLKWCEILRLRAEFRLVPISRV